jgi:hypothetical protein
LSLETSWELPKCENCRWSRQIKSVSGLVVTVDSIGMRS